MADKETAEAIMALRDKAERAGREVAKVEGEEAAAQRRLAELEQHLAEIGVPEGDLAAEKEKLGAELAAIERELEEIRAAV